jgi:hypothetical protein
LYLAETTTGKFGVYTMGPGANGSGIAIRRHDLSNFRASTNPIQQVGGVEPSKPMVSGAPTMPNGVPGGVEVIQPATLPPTPPVKK